MAGAEAGFFCLPPAATAFGSTLAAEGFRGVSPEGARDAALGSTPFFGKGSPLPSFAGLMANFGAGVSAGTPLLVPSITASLSKAFSGLTPSEGLGFMCPVFIALSARGWSCNILYRVAKVIKHCGNIRSSFSPYLGFCPSFFSLSWMPAVIEKSMVSFL